jgi:very-short-patch-repair endonuclease
MKSEPIRIARSRRLRRDATWPEVILWRSLRGRGLGEFKFRRQQPIGRYVVDFFCSASALIVELDGDSHIERKAEDDARQRWLESSGYRVVRISNDDVLQNLEGVLIQIERECTQANFALSPPGERDAAQRQGEGAELAPATDRQLNSARPKATGQEAPSPGLRPSSPARGEEEKSPLPWRERDAAQRQGEGDGLAPATDRAAASDRSRITPPYAVPSPGLRPSSPSRGEEIQR